MSELQQLARRALACMDLTTLNDDDSEATIAALCRQAQSPAGDTAAVCVYPRFIPLAAKLLREQGAPSIRLATVSNFPHGRDDIDIACAETRAAVAYGADEVDVVFPWRALINGNGKVGAELVRACKAICQEQNRLLKVIIESGELQQPARIRQATVIAIETGADFVKTSTGKVPVNATLESAEIILNTIRDQGVQDRVGFKAAGGVREMTDAARYLQLADEIMGPGWSDPRHFRFGASGLLNSVLTTLGIDGTSAEKPARY